MHSLKRIALALLAGLLAPAPAAAHPHVWIDVHADIQVSGGSVDGIAIVWRFDEFFSEWLIPDADQDGDGRFDEAETARIKAESFDGLAHYGWFTHVILGADELMLDGRIGGFAAAIEDGRVVYRFRVEFEPGLPVAGASLRLGFYDPEFYVSLSWDETDPVRVTDGGCSWTIAKDPTNAIYFGLVHPDMLRLTCAGS